MGWSAVLDLGISWSYSITFCTLLTITPNQASKANKFKHGLLATNVSVFFT